MAPVLLAVPHCHGVQSHPIRAGLSARVLCSPRSLGQAGEHAAARGGRTCPQRPSAAAAAVRCGPPGRMDQPASPRARLRTGAPPDHLVLTSEAGYSVQPVLFQSRTAAAEQAEEEQRRRGRLRSPCARSTAAQAAHAAGQRTLAPLVCHMLQALSSQRHPTQPPVSKTPYKYPFTDVQPAATLHEDA